MFSKTIIWLGIRLNPENMTLEHDSGMTLMPEKSLIPALALFP